MLNPDFVEEFSGNPTHSFRLLLQQKDISQWAPQAPLRLIHCSGDFTIPFENSQLVFNHIKKMGIDQVELINPSTTGDHSQCILPSLGRAKELFDAMKE